MNPFLYEELYGEKSGSMYRKHLLGTQDHDSLADLFGKFSFGSRGGDAMFSENAIVLAKLLENTALSQALNQNIRFTESSVGVDMAIDAMNMLTAYVMEITEMPVSELNKKCDGIVNLDYHDTLRVRVVTRLRENYNVDWLEAYVRMASMRLTFGKANRQDKLLVAGINTRVMKGQVAVPIVKIFGIPIKDWALEGPAALYALSLNLPQADDLLPNEFDREETIEGFLQALTQEGLRFALTHHYDEVHSLYLYLADGDEDTADHNVKMLKKAYGIPDKSNDDKEESFDPSETDISKLDVLFGGDLLVH